MSLNSFSERVRVEEEAKWAKVKTPGRIAFVVLVVTQAEFDWMKSSWGEYSTTIPSGKYLGKRWLRAEHNHDGCGHPQIKCNPKTQWFMGHYVESTKGPDMIGIQFTPISIEKAA